MTLVPLSRSYGTTAWPIATFNVMSKPAGPACNLACEYSFYKHNAEKSRNQKEESRNGVDPQIGADVRRVEDLLARNVCGNRRESADEGVVSDGLLERFVREYIQAQDNPSVFFTWQGGEPTLAGLDFYRKVVELQKKHARAEVIISNSIQTNGVLLDEDWCRFLNENRWPVGISIDGPADVHDAFRRTRGGAGTYAQVRKAIDLLHKYEIRFDTLSTITPLNVHRVEELYEFIMRELRPAVAQFQPCVERKDHATVAPGYWPADTVLRVGDERLIPGRPDSIMTDWSITAQDWGRFLCQVFELWWQRGQ